MLEHKLTPNHAGMALWGDYASLSRLHKFIHHVVEESHYIEDDEGFVLGLAYDVRKAFERQRSQGYRGHHDEDHCQVFGVEILWPVLLVQVSVLRQAMAFMPTNKLDQSIMFELEYIVECALREALPIGADEVVARIPFLASAPYVHLDTILDSRCRYFIELPATQRLKALPKLMETFDPMYEHYAKAGASIRAGTISPNAFVDDDSEWPDFEW